MPIADDAGGRRARRDARAGFDAALAGGFIGLIAGLVFNSWRKSRAARREPAAARRLPEAIR